MNTIQYVVGMLLMGAGFISLINGVMYSFIKVDPNQVERGFWLLILAALSLPLGALLVYLASRESPNSECIPSTEDEIRKYVHVASEEEN